eukprot:8145844-Pyramimonas_sp.AAC.1
MALTALAAWLRLARQVKEQMKEQGAVLVGRGIPVWLAKFLAIGGPVGYICLVLSLGREVYAAKQQVRFYTAR